MGYIASYTMKNGDPSKIMAPVDADGLFCGRVNTVTDSVTGLTVTKDYT